MTNPQGRICAGFERGNDIGGAGLELPVPQKRYRHQRSVTTRETMVGVSEKQ